VEKAAGSGYTFGNDKYKRDFTQNWEVLTANQKLGFMMIQLILLERNSHPKNENLRLTQNGPRGELHHLLPKSLGGGDGSENIIHVICGESNYDTLFIQILKLKILWISNLFFTIFT